MLLSQKIMSRQSEVRELLAALASVQDLDESQAEEMANLDSEYHQNERRYRAALVSEDDARERANHVHDGAERREWGQLVGAFEIRQVVMNLAEGRPLAGETAEVVTELRNRGGYRGCPVPILALESRAGTTSSDVGSSTLTMPIIDRLFPDSMAAAMGGSLRTIQTGAVEYPVSTSKVAAAWATTEGGDVAGGKPYSTSERTLKPDHTLGVQVQVTRRALLALDGLEDAIRRDMRGAIQSSLDKAVFQGSRIISTPPQIPTVNGSTPPAVVLSSAFDVSGVPLVSFKALPDISTLPAFCESLSNSVMPLPASKAESSSSVQTSGRIRTRISPGPLAALSAMNAANSALKSA